MKKFILSLIALIIVFAVGYGAWYLFGTKNVQAPTQTPVENQVSNDTNSATNQTSVPSSGADMQLYTNKENNFSFSYNSDFKLLSNDDNARLPWSYISSRPGSRLVTVQLPKELMPKTNFGEASVSVGISSEPAEVSGCLLGDSPVPETKEINGTQFTKLTGNDAGAGNFYETTSYRVLKNKTCMAAEELIHSTNIGNYSPDQGITEFDKTKIQAELDEVVNSFKFTK